MKHLYMVKTDRNLGINDKLANWNQDMLSHSGKRAAVDSRQAVEQVFDVSKNYAELLPLRVHNEDTFRGHLMMSFMATVAYLSINKSLKESPFNAEGAFLILGNQKCKVFDNQILPKEPNRKMNEIYKKFKIGSPVSITIGGNT